jgi:hypothetical protein
MHDADIRRVRDTLFAPLRRHDVEPIKDVLHKRNSSAVQRRLRVLTELPGDILMRHYLGDVL